ncbi:hypothetical protein V6Z11_A06G084800 [Gossypium hirsutum]
MLRNLGIKLSLAKTVRFLKIFLIKVAIVLLLAVFMKKYRYCLLLFAINAAIVLSFAVFSVCGVFGVMFHLTGCNPNTCILMLHELKQSFRAVFTFRLRGCSISF